MTALFAAFGLVLLAELGDKSMLLALVLTPRYGAVRVLAALSLQAAVAMALAVLLAGAVDLLLPDQVLALGAGLLFIGFGVWALRDDPDDDEDAVATSPRRSAVLVVPALAAAFFVAELGDKTQLAAFTFSGLTPGDRLGVWAGSTAGLVAADTLAVLAGRWLARAVSRRLLSRAAGVLFVLFGLGAIVVALI